MNYSDFISLCDSKNALLQYDLEMQSDDKYYSLFFYDGPARFECQINSTDNSSNVSDFETNYKDTANQAIEKRDPYTKQLQVNPRSVEGTLEEDFIQFTTGDDESLFQ